ncbi:MAG TPA: ERAP1-like C-terminal domain-containing protein, partial [Anaeromyxobacteraceae bacterium]
EPAERARLVALLGRFREPGLAAAALELAASPDTEPADAAALLGEALQGRETRPAALAALRRGWDGLVPRLSPGEAARLVEAAARPACDPAAHAEVAALLGPRVSALDGAARSLDLGLEAAGQCAAARARGAGAVARLLGR